MRSPAFTLAISANASIFAVVHRVLLNPLPYGDSERLIALDYGAPSLSLPSGIANLTSQQYYQLADRARALDGVAIYETGELTVTGGGEPERIRVARATPSLAPVLGVSPALGRWFSDVESAPGGLPVVVLSHGLWARRYAQDAGVIGRTVALNGVPTTVVGVMPPAFAFPKPDIDVWMPAAISRAAPSLFNFNAVARLRAGVTLADARAEMTRLSVDLSRESALQGPFYVRLRSTATTLIEATVGRVAATLWILLASVGLVLLVACANVANLFLVRSEARQREVAVRRALGAGNGGIARYFLAESALLSIAGGAAGLAMAWGAVRLLVAFAPTSVPRLHEVRLDEIDANVAVAEVGTLEDALERASGQMEFTMVLIAIAAGVALMLGVIGIYGAMSYIVTQRTGEIGVRLALGAEPGSVARMIVRQGAVVAIAGVIVGLAAAFAGSRLIASLLYGISPRDPAVFAATTTVLMGVALLACWLPARRAARLSPLEALRTE